MKTPFDSVILILKNNVDGEFVPPKVKKLQNFLCVKEWAITRISIHYVLCRRKEEWLQGLVTFWRIYAFLSNTQ